MKNLIKEKIRAESIRQLIYQSRMCAHCGVRKAQQIHHLIYRWRPRPEDVVLLCKQCHIKTFKKGKRGIEVNDKLDNLMNLTKIDRECYKKILAIEKEYFTIHDINRVLGRKISGSRSKMEKYLQLGLLTKIRMSPVLYSIPNQKQNLIKMED